MNRVSVIGLALLVGVTLTFATLYFVERHSHLQDASSSSKLIYQLLHKPTQVKIEYRTFAVKVPHYIYIDPTSTKVDTTRPKEINCDSIANDYYTEKTYDGTYKDSTLAMKWEATIGQNKLKSLLYPQLDVTCKDSVVTEQNDTCIEKKPAYKPKNHWVMMIGGAAKNFKEFPILHLNGGYSIKDRVFIAPGVLYNSADGRFYGDFVIGIYLN